VRLTVTDSLKGSGLASVPLHLVLGQSAPALKVVSIKGKPEAPAPEAAGGEDIDSPPPSRTPRNDDAYAVLVGIEKYRDIPRGGLRRARRPARCGAYFDRVDGFSIRKNVILFAERARDLDGPDDLPRPVA